MAQHTPGPWEVREGCSFPSGKRTVTDLHVILPRDQDGDDVAIAADIINPLSEKIDDVAYANARLIAAAPDLLETCTVVLNYVVLNYINGSLAQGSTLPIHTAAGLLRKIIAKAESPNAQQ